MLGHQWTLIFIDAHQCTSMYINRNFEFGSFVPALKCPLKLKIPFHLSMSGNMFFSSRTTTHNVQWHSSISGIIWSCWTHFEMFKWLEQPQIMKIMTPENFKKNEKSFFPNVSGIKVGRSQELQVIKNNVFEWIPACKLDEIWQHKIWPSWHRNWPR